MNAIELPTTPAPQAAPTPCIERPTAPVLVEYLLKDLPKVDRILVEPSVNVDLVTRLLGIALTGFTIFGLAMATVMDLSGLDTAWLPAARWSDGSAFWLVLAYDLGLVAACGVCLPSFYFYGLLGGVRMSMVEVTAHTAKCLAASGIALVGILPFYVAIALGHAVFGAEPHMMRYALCLGLGLPFVAGLWGVRTLYQGFLNAAQRQAQAAGGRVVRTVFLGRLLLSWAGVYTAVTPVMIWTLWTGLAGKA